MLPSSLMKNQSALERLNPNWESRVWDYTQIRILLETHFPTLLPMFENPTRVLHPAIYRINPRATQSDIGRWVIMYLYGGAYLDMDVECIAPLDDIMVPMGKPHMLAYGYQFLKVSGQMFMATPQHPILTQAIQICQEANTPLDVGNSLTRAFQQCPLSFLNQYTYIFRNQDVSVHHCGVANKCMIPIKPDSSNQIGRKFLLLWCRKRHTVLLLMFLVIIVLFVLFAIIYRPNVDYNTCRVNIPLQQLVCDLKRSKPSHEP